MNWSAVRTSCATRATISVASSPARKLGDSVMLAMPPRTRSDVSVTPFGIVVRRSSFFFSPLDGPFSSSRMVTFTPPSADSPARRARLRDTTRPSPAMKKTRTERADLPTGGAPSAAWSVSSSGCTGFTAFANAAGTIPCAARNAAATFRALRCSTVTSVLRARTREVVSCADTRSSAARRPGLASDADLRSATKPRNGVPANAPFVSFRTASFSCWISGSVANA